MITILILILIKYFTNCWFAAGAQAGARGGGVQTAGAAAARPAPAQTGPPDGRQQEGGGRSKIIYGLFLQFI